MKTRMQGGVEVLDGDQEFTVYFSHGYARIPTDEELLTINDGTPVKDACAELDGYADDMVGNSSIEYGWRENERVGSDNNLPSGGSAK